jgi:hypothetical protein
MRLRRFLQPVMPALMTHGPWWRGNQMSRDRKEFGKDILETITLFAIAFVLMFGFYGFVRLLGF